MRRAERRASEREVADEILMARYAAGDSEAFDELFLRYEPRAYVFFLKRTGSPGRAEDLYQELFLRIHRARGRYDPTRPFTPWFFQIANRLLIDDHRRAFRDREVSVEDRDLRVEGPGAEQQVAAKQEIQQLLHSLSPEECYLVLSAKAEGVGYPELAEQLGKSVDAVKKMVSRAVLRLRAALPPPLEIHAR
jgi:RNA polymerase sigma-70 factor (ECF subfamily)